MGQSFLLLPEGISFWGNGIEQPPQITQSRQAQCGTITPNQRCAVSFIEHPFRQRGGGIVRQQHLQCSRGAAAGQHPDILANMGMAGVIYPGHIQNFSIMWPFSPGFSSEI